MINAKARRVWLKETCWSYAAKSSVSSLDFLADAEKVSLRKTFMSDGWDEHRFGSTTALDFHIAALRKKIDTEDQPHRISTVRGIGFRYETS